MTNNPQFDNFISHLLSRKQYKSYLKKAIKQYDITKYRITDLTVCDIKRMYGKILSKYYSGIDHQHVQEIQNEQNSWLINELKIFVWIVVCYAGFHDQQLECLVKICFIVDTKCVGIFGFSIPFQTCRNSLISTSIIIKRITHHQINQKVVKRIGTTTFNHIKVNLIPLFSRDPSIDGKWNQISKLFFIKSGKKYFRKPQKCREHWYNHLNPTISHDPWSIEEDLALIQNVNSKGKKWAQISLSMGGQRTEHMVKNRYKSLEKRYEVEIKKSFIRQLDVSMIVKKANDVNNQVYPTQQKKNQSGVASGNEETESFLILATFPTNIDRTSLEVQFLESDKMDDNFKCSIESQLIEVTDDKFFDNSKQSISLLNEFDDDMEKYVESFLL